MMQIDSRTRPELQGGRSRPAEDRQPRPGSAPIAIDRTRPRGATAIALAAATLLASGAVAVARLDDGPTTVTPSPELGAMHLVVDQIGARDMWAAGITGDGVGVAVVDTGVAAVDALRGQVAASVDFSIDQSDPARIHDDAFGHGTHLAGIIAGREPGADPLADEGFFGVAPDAEIVSVKVAGGDGAVTLESVIAGIDWVIDHADEHGIRVVTLALDTADRVPYETHALNVALERAWHAGIVVVTGAGNEGASAGLNVPANDPFIITVGAVDVTVDGPTVPSWTSRGDGVRDPDLAAPGAHLESLVAPGSDADLHHPEGRISESIIRGSGTSQAAAVVAGSVALLLDARPELTPDQVKAVLVGSAGDVAGDPAAVGAGLVDVAAAVGHELATDVVQDHPRAVAGVIAPATGSELFVPAVAGWSWAGNSWIGNSWIGNSWIGNSWIGNSWIGNSWIGNSWIGNSWIGNSWIGNSWIGNSWIGNSWIGNSWIGNSWIGNSWIGNSWIGNSWI